MKNEQEIRIKMRLRFLLDSRNRISVLFMIYVRFISQEKWAKLLRLTFSYVLQVKQNYKCNFWNVHTRASTITARASYSLGALGMLLRVSD